MPLTVPNICRLQLRTGFNSHRSVNAIGSLNVLQHTTSSLNRRDVIVIATSTSDTAPRVLKGGALPVTGSSLRTGRWRYVCNL